MNPSDDNQAFRERTAGTDAGQVYTFGDFRVHLQMSVPPVTVSAACRFYGCPVVGSGAIPRVASLEADLNDVAGHFVCIISAPDRFIAAGDVFGGYRLYYLQHGYDVYLSDTYSLLIDILRSHDRPRPQPQELIYWRRHGYTTGEATLVEQIAKLAPASILEITADGATVRSYFRELPHEPNAAAHAASFLCELQSVLAAAVRGQASPLLCFSGGGDSLLLGAVLRDAGVDFTPVFFRTVPPTGTNAAECERAVHVARQNGFNLELLEVPVHISDARLDEITRDTAMDRHFAVLHFEGARLLAERYGTDRPMLNGQTNDSILCYGPSGRTRGDWVARVLMYRPFGLSARLACAAVNFKLGSGLRVPIDNDEYLLAFFDQRQYFTLLEQEPAVGYRAYLEAMVTRQTARLAGRAARLMWLKLYGFIQGSDTQVVIRSAAAAGFTRAILPYAAPALIYSTLKHKDERRDLWQPKYVMAQALKSLGCVLPDEIGRHKRSSDPVLDELNARLNHSYARALNAFLAPDR